MTTKRGQMSESLLVGTLLALAGGFLDAYTYLIRGEVFANAQTGNIVLLGIHLIGGEWMRALCYLIPIVSFSAGVLLVLCVRRRTPSGGSRLHWRQVVVVLEIALLLCVAFLPQKLNMLANIMVSFTCAMQVEGFRKIRGVTCATTMCTGNLRSGTELLWNFHQKRDPELLRRGLHYFLVDLLFVFGAMAGVLVTKQLAERAVLAVCVLLGIAFLAMFIEEDIFEHH